MSGTAIYKVGAGDECLHLEECDPTKNWMENMCFFAFDEKRRAGFLVHMKNRPNQGNVEFRLAACNDGKTVTYGSVQPLNGGFKYPDFHLDCIEPDRKWKITSKGKGWPIESVGGVIGMPNEKEGPVAFELDLEWRATIDSLDWAVVRGNDAAAAPGGRHYDQGARVIGKIRVGDTEVQVDSLAYRDHSWGPRAFKEMKRVYFFGFVSEDMKTYYDGSQIDLPGDQGSSGFSFLLEEGKLGVVEPPIFTVTKGEDRPGGYDTVQVDVGGRRYIAHKIWNILMPLVPERYLSGVCMVRVELEGGRKGFGIVERGYLFSEAELAAWKTAAASPRL